MNKKPKPLILFDMDCSLFDYQHAMVTSLNEMAENDSELIKNDQNLWGIDNNPLYKERQDIIKARKGWWTNLPPIQLGFDVFNHCKSLGYKIEILTKGPRKFPNAWAEKLECCQMHFGPKINVNVVTSKKYFFGNILYDDLPSYLSDWLKQNVNSFAIMPIYPSNIKYFHNRLHRLDNNLDEIKKELTRFIEEF